MDITMLIIIEEFRLDYSQKNSTDFTMYWKYYPAFRVMDQQEMVTRFAVFLMLFAFISVILFASVIKEGLYRLPISSILYFYSSGRKIYAVTEERTYDYYGKMKEAEEKAGDAFVRIHQRYLVQAKKVEAILGAMMSPYLERKKGFLYGLCYYGILFSTATIPIFIGDPVNIIGIFPFYLLAIMISSEGSRVSRFSIALIFYPVFMVFNMITDEIDSFTLNQMSTTTILLIQTGIKIGMALAFYGLSSLVHLKGTETKRRTLPAHLWYLIDLLACMPFASVLFQVTLTDATLTYPASSS